MNDLSNIGLISEITRKNFDDFKNHKVKASEIFYICEISKVEAYNLISKYHYLGDAKFFSVKCYGLFTNCHEFVGAATYSQPSGPKVMKSWFGFGLDNSVTNIWELSRLCVLPALNGTNASSYLLGNSLRLINKLNNEAKQYHSKNHIPFTENDWVCRCVITLANSNRHVGSIYQVCNFKYYGLTPEKFELYTEDGKINPRISTKNARGVWLPKDRKFRYAYIFDKSLNILLQEDSFPNKDFTIQTQCCNGTNVVYDKRFDTYYTCPKCTGRLNRIVDGIEIEVNKPIEAEQNLWD